MTVIGGEFGHDLATSFTFMSWWQWIIVATGALVALVGIICAVIVTVERRRELKKGIVGATSSSLTRTHSTGSASASDGDDDRVNKHKTPKKSRSSGNRPQQELLIDDSSEDELEYSSSDEQPPTPALNTPTSRLNVYVPNSKDSLDIRVATMLAEMECDIFEGQIRKLGSRGLYEMFGERVLVFPHPERPEELWVQTQMLNADGTDRMPLQNFLHDHLPFSFAKEFRLRVDSRRKQLTHNPG